MLIGSVLTGFAQVSLTQSASGVITSYSTVTSTYYSTWYGTTTSTQFRTTFSRTVTQTKGEGPYLDVTGLEFGFYYYEPSKQVSSVYIVEGAIRNSMGIPIEEGVLTVLVTNKDDTVEEEALFSFSRIEARSYRSLAGQTVRLGKQWLLTDIGNIHVVHVVFVCSGITVEVPVATYVFAETRTYTYVTTGTIAYTLSEPQSPLNYALIVLVVFSGAVLVMLSLEIARNVHNDIRSATEKKRVVRIVVAALCLIGFLYLVTSGWGIWILIALVPTMSLLIYLLQKKEKTPSKFSVKTCIKCAYQLPIDAEYCDECGAKQTTEVKQ